jgi:hypothetical protein
VYHIEGIHDFFKHSKPIGIFRLDISTVYNEKDHVFQRKWAELINSETVDSPCALLLLSIALVQHGVTSKVRLRFIFYDNLLIDLTF